MDKRAVLIPIILAVLVSGCWDQDYLKDARLVYGSAFDLTPDGKLLDAVVIREASGVGTEVKPFDEFYTAKGDTPRQLRDILDLRIAGDFRAYKSRIILIGEKLAKTDIYPLLDVWYRDPKSALNSHIAVASGSASEILGIREVGNKLIAEYLDELIASESEKTVVPDLNVRMICPLLLDPGKDFVLPYLRKTDGDVSVDGLALFHGHRMTGRLGANDSLLLMLLMKEQGRVSRITRRIHENKKTNIENFITIDVENVKRKMKVETDSAGNVHVKLKAKFLCSVAEYPDDHLDQDEIIQGLNKKLSHDLTKQAKELIAKLQEAKCDVFGIGRELIAFHPEVWKKKNWEKDYPKVRFEPKIDVEIVSHGIIN